MTLHTYLKESKIVLMGWIKIADWRSELRHMELSLPIVESLLATLPPEDNELGLNASQLLDVMERRGPDATYLSISGAKDKLTRTLAALTKAAWEYEAPFSVDEVDDAPGDEYFDAFVAAYTPSEEDKSG